MNVFCVYIKINKLEVSNETLNKELETLKQQSNGLTDLQRDFNRLHMVYVRYLIQANAAGTDLLDFDKGNWSHL